MTSVLGHDPHLIDDVIEDNSLSSSITLIEAKGGASAFSATFSPNRS